MAFPKRFPDREEIAVVRAEADGLEPGAEAERQHRLAGRVLARRDMGKLMFLDLVDRSGRIQLLIRPDDLGGVDVDLGDIVGVSGVATKTKRGEPSLAVRELTLLGKIRTSLPDTFHGLTDTEQRYRKRYLDLLMNEDARRDALVRSRMITAIRAYLDGEGFVEVETPILQPQYGGAFAEPFVTHSNYLDQDVYLRIADELYLKRLIVGGLEKVYEISKDFRNEGVSYKHSPEFTQLEWYEAYADYNDTMERTETLVERAAQEAIGTTKVTFRGHEIDLARPWKRVKFVEALEEKGVRSRDPDELRAKLDAAGVDTSHDKTWAQLVDHAYSHFVEPDLIQPTFVIDWPIEMSPFARSTDDDPALVERFEAVVAGMEFANAFSELNDSAEQAERFAMQAAEKAAGDATAEEGDPDYVEALSYGMPPTGGCGIGMDRLAMVLTGRDTIRDVILFPALDEREQIIDIAVPDRWWFEPLASLTAETWWSEEIIPRADAILRGWITSRRMNVQQIVGEATEIARTFSSEHESDLDQFQDPMSPTGDIREEIVQEAAQLRVPWLGPNFPEWFEYKVSVKKSVASALESPYEKAGDLQPVLEKVRRDLILYQDQRAFDYARRGTFNGLALLSAIRSGDSREALVAQRSFLELHVTRASP